MHVLLKKYSFPSFHEIHSHNTRLKNKIILPAHSSTIFHKHVKYMGSSFLNGLPECLIDKDLSTKANLPKIRVFLLEKAFYDIIKL